MFELFKKIWSKRKTTKVSPTVVFKPSVDKNLTAVTSFDEYSNLIKEAKENSKSRLFTNCYMMPDEIKRLISIRNFYYMKTDNGLMFVDDEGSYYYMFLYVDLACKLTLPKLNKDVLIENIYYDGRKTENQTRFEEILKNTGCNFLNTYNAITEKPQMPSEKYWKKLSVMEKSLALEGKKITNPTNWQLWQYERIYRETIDKYVQKRYTRKERKEQRDLGLLECISDKKGKIYAIRISSVLHGGAIATKKEYQGSIYSPILMLKSFKTYYENMPEDPETQKEYMRNKGANGWIAVDNKASWRLHKMLGMTATGKSMNQFVISAK